MSSDLMSVPESSLFDQLLNACETWNLEEVRAVLETGFNVDTADDDRVTALQIAAANGNIGIVEYLLDMGANIEKDNQIGMTPLHHAARNGHCNVIRILLQRGAVIDKLTYYGASALTLAASGGHAEIVEFLLNLNLSVNPQEKRDTALGPTPVMAAVFRRHTHICVLLSQKGANLDDSIPRLDNLSAMSVAITCDAKVMVGTLLELKSNPAFRSLGNRKPHELARDLKRDEIFALLENARYLATETKLQKKDIRELIQNRDEIKLREALQCKLVRNFPEESTPLMYAVLLANLNIVKVVRQETHELNAAEEVLGLTPLMFATLIGNNEMVEYLLGCGADVSQVSKDHFNALDYAFSLGNLDARTLCLMQHYLETGTGMTLKSDLHLSGSRSGMAKLLKIGFGSSSNSAENKEKFQSQTQHIENLLNICAARNSVRFRTANEYLLSGTCGKEKVDEYHKKLQKIRSLAEHCMMFGLSPLPTWFTTEDFYSCKLDTRNAGPVSVSVLKKHSAELEKERAVFCLAQRNAQLFNECYFGNHEIQRSTIGDSKTRRVFEQNERRKTNSSPSTSTIEGKSFRRAVRSYSSLQHSFSNALRTAPDHSVRCSRESMEKYNEGRMSPSRRSLNQYTFTFKDEKKQLKKSTSTSALDKESFKISDVGMMRSFPISVQNASLRKCKKSVEAPILNNLEQVGLSNYIELFKQNEIDEDALLLLSEQDLEALIADEADRERLKIFIQNMKRINIF